jgi:NAD(P)-dependent dehydrogenase (short-subunit alcohol dehydrogenase family)
MKSNGLAKSLCEFNSRAGTTPSGIFNAPSRRVARSPLGAASTVPLASLGGRCVLLATYDPLPTELARLELDGVARCMADPMAVARSVEFLLGETGLNITGATLTIDAGNTA